MLYAKHSPAVAELGNSWNAMIEESAEETDKHITQINKIWLQLVGWIEIVILWRSKLTDKANIQLYQQFYIS